MPQGFRELTLTGLLSIQLINRLMITRSQVVHLMATATNDNHDKDWLTLLLVLRPLERLSWFAVLVYHLRSSTYIANCKALAEAVLECTQTDLNSRAEKECLLWGACLLVAAPDTDQRLGSERETILAMMPQMFQNLNFDQISDVAKRFLWSEGLSRSLGNILMHRHMSAKSRKVQVHLLARGCSVKYEVGPRRAAKALPQCTS